MTDPTDLTPAERAAYGPIYEAAHSIDHSMLRLVDGATCQRCESTARAVVAAARPLIEADALDAIAEAATTYGPPSTDHLRGIAFTVRQTRTPVRDWLARDTTEGDHPMTDQATPEPLTDEDLAEARAGRVETTTHAIETEDRERAREVLERHGMADRGCVIGDDVSTPGPTVPGDGEFLTLAQAAGHLHDWARDLAGGTRTDWPAGHPDIIRGIRAAADWLDARDRYETETRDARAARLREAGRRLGESFQQLGEAIRDGAAKARAAREAGLIGDTDA